MASISTLFQTSEASQPPHSQRVQAMGGASSSSFKSREQLQYKQKDAAGAARKLAPSGNKSEFVAAKSCNDEGHRAAEFTTPRRTKRLQSITLA